jgi:hypothetical protein
MLDSLVRVSRRDDKNHFHRVALAPQTCRPPKRWADPYALIRPANFTLCFPYVNRLANPRDTYRPFEVPFSLGDCHTADYQE